MGKIADKIKHICGIQVSSCGCENAELAIKKAIMKIGRKMIKELENPPQHIPIIRVDKVEAINQFLKKIDQM